MAISVNISASRFEMQVTKACAVLLFPRSPHLVRTGMKVRENVFLVKTWCSRPGSPKVTKKVLAVTLVLNACVTRAL